MVMREPFTEARLLTVNEVADLLRVSRMTVYRLIKTGEMSAFRVGRGYRLREEDIDSYLTERYTEAGYRQSALAYHAAPNLRAGRRGA